MYVFTCEVYGSNLSSLQGGLFHLACHFNWDSEESHESLFLLLKQRTTEWTFQRNSLVWFLCLIAYQPLWII